VNRHARAGIDAIQSLGRGLDPDSEERQAVNLGEDEVGGDEPYAAPDRLAEQLIGVDVMLVAPAL